MGVHLGVVEGVDSWSSFMGGEGLVESMPRRQPEGRRFHPTVALATTPTQSACTREIRIETSLWQCVRRVSTLGVRPRDTDDFFTPVGSRIRSMPCASRLDAEGDVRARRGALPQ